jgi:hypothetical protein
MKQAFSNAAEDPTPCAINQPTNISTETLKLMWRNPIPTQRFTLEPRESVIVGPIATSDSVQINILFTLFFMHIKRLNSKLT